MRLSFNLEDINYLNITFVDGDEQKKTVKFALKEKKENEIVAITKEFDFSTISYPQKVSIDIICHDGLYKTSSMLGNVYNEEGQTYFVLKNPDTLDYQQNREYYRIIAKYDCIYTVETDDGMESFNAVTYDISAGGVSIILDKNVISMDETKILIFMSDRDLKSHLSFVRSEVYEDNYKLSFEFTDLSERDQEMLSKLCVVKQLES